jgi:hypothetical protein
LRRSSAKNVDARQADLGGGFDLKRRNALRLLRPTDPYGSVVPSGMMVAR